MKRRDFIKTMGIGAAGLVLGGCGVHSKVVTKVDANPPGNHGVAANLLKPAKYRLMPRTGEKSAQLDWVQVTCMNPRLTKLKSLLFMPLITESILWIP